MHRYEVRERPRGHLHSRRHLRVDDLPVTVSLFPATTDKEWYLILDSSPALHTLLHDLGAVGTGDHVEAGLK